MKNTKAVGVLTDERIKLKFMEDGFTVSVPVGDNARYDFILDADGKLLRIQSKTGNLIRSNGALNFSCTSIQYNSTGTHRVRYTKRDIDYFATMNPETREIYLVPVEICHTECNLWYREVKNRGVRNIKYASDYVADRIIESL